MNKDTTSDKSHYTILFAGGAFAALALAKRLVDHAKSYPFQLLIIEKSDSCNGLAYNINQSPYVTTNNPAKTCSIDASDENNFIDWSAKFGWPHSPDCYPPRYFFGKYLEHTLAKIISSASNKRIQFNYICGEEVVDCERQKDGSYLVYSQLKLEEKRIIYRANTVILATGNNKPNLPKFAKNLSPSRIVENTMTVVNQKKISAFDVDQNIAIIGSGFSAMDAMTIRFFEKIKPALDYAQNSASIRQQDIGKIYMISRRGLINYIPSEEPEISVNYTLSNQVCLTLVDTFFDSNKLIQLLNQEFRRGESLGYTKHQVVLALDNVLIELLEKLSSDSERHKFIKDYWTVLHAHQNELQEPSAKIFQLLEQEEILQVMEGHIKGNIHMEGEDVVIEFEENREPLKVDAVINTAGLEHSYEELVHQNALLTNLEKRGYISPHRKTNLGLEVNERYEAINRDGFSMPNLHPVGRLIEGEAIYKKFGLWFTGNSGIRSIRNMCAELAPIILQDIELKSNSVI
ncbi:MAG: SidA/IucD/PvdA family monooxygenase [Symploca sp. SIO2E6]|nr:SidA/IucD/PvdA family monooxygenase [Symploca sp. SIO2E6]